MGLAEWFSTFNKNLRMSDSNISTIADRYKRITNRLNLDFRNLNSDISYSFYVGSYGRGTEIHLSDIDVIYELPPEWYIIYRNYSSNSNGPSQLLQRVKTSILKTYPNSNIIADGQVVQIYFDDKIKFELVPGFRQADGSYDYPDTNNGGSWKNTNPKPEMTEITKKNLELNKNLKNLCRMARAWKDEWNVPIGGLLIDTLAYNFLTSYEHNSKTFIYYDYISRDFFKYLSERNPEQNYWLSPGGKQSVYRKGPFEYKAKQCYNIALEAINDEKKYPSYAKNFWRKIFGGKFPIHID